MKKKLLTLFVVVAAIALLVAGFDYVSLRSLRGDLVTLYKPEYVEGGAFVEISAGPSQKSTWVLLGTADKNLAFTISAPPARSFYFGPNYSSVQHNGTFEVRIHRKHLGLLWLPEKTLSFEVPREQLAQYSQATWQAFLSKAKP